MRLWKRIVEYALIKAMAACQRQQAARTPPAPQRILAFEMFGIGDAICALPAVRALRQRYPAARLTLVVNPASLSLGEIPYADEVTAGPFSYGALMAFWQRHWPERKQTLAVLLNDGWWPNLAALGIMPAWACGYCYRRRLDTRYQPDRLTTASWADLGENVACETHLVVRAALAVKPALAETAVDLSPLRELQRTLSSIPLDTPPWWLATAKKHRLVLHPGTRGSRKQWPLARWQGVAADWLADPKNVICLTGGPQEMALANAIAADLPAERTWLAAGATSLRQLGALFLQAGCLVAPDCGPAHLASALGCPTVVLMGATQPATCAPFWPPSRILFHPVAPLPVEMTDMQVNDPHPNMLAIWPDEVLAAVREILRQNEDA